MVNEQEIQETINKVNEIEGIRKLREKNQIAYEYVRGSHLYNLNIATSDLDIGGIYICEPDDILGLGFNYQEQVGDRKGDTVYYEIGKFCRLLCSSNPTIMEALWVPKDKIIGEIHPVVQELIDNREEFLSKEIFNAFSGYAISQIKKARGLNKKIVNPIVERKTLLDFCFTRYKQGSTKIMNWLEYRGLKQEYCGLVNIPNMHDVYGVYYDFGMHIEIEYRQKGIKDLNDALKQCKDDKFLNYLINDRLSRQTPIGKEIFFNKTKPIGYKGMVGTMGPESNELRLSSVDIDDTAICDMYYNQSGYTKHCRDYKEYKEWESNRNPARYESNLKSNYDRKNISHCVRLIHMGLEVARGEGLNVVRTWDNDFLREIREGNIEYEEIISYVDEKKKELDDAIDKTKIREKVNVELIDKILKECRLQTIKGGE